MSTPETVCIFNENISNSDLEKECQVMLADRLIVYDIVRKDGKLFVYFSKIFND